MRSLMVVCLLSAAVVAQESNTQKAADLYQRALVSLAGLGQSQDVLGAVDLMKQSANLGYKPAEMAEGYILETGYYSATNLRDAASWYQKAAEQDDDTAAWLLARMYYLGEIPGTPYDCQKWARRSAEAGNPFGAYFLALSLISRDDPKGALPFLKAAAEKGLPYAQLRYAQALTDARSVAVNKHEAAVWYQIAYDSGLSEASLPLEQLQSSLGTTESNQARSEALRLEPKVLRKNNAGSCTGWPGELDTIPSPPPLLSVGCRDL